MLNRRHFLKQTTAAFAGGFLLANEIKAAGYSAKSHLDRIGLQLFSVPKLLEQDFEGTMKMVAGTGYKELEFFGPYPFSVPSAQERWNAVAPSLGFKQSGYFGHTPEQVKDILDKNGLSSPSMHIDLDTLRSRMNETAEAANIVGQQYVGIAAIPEEERKNLDAYKRIAEEFNKIGESAKKEGLKFFYHNHGYGLKEMEGKIPFDLILENTDPGLVFLEMDLYWTTAGGADPVAYLDKYPNRFKLMHVKDMSKAVRFSGDGGDPQQWIELFPYMTDAGSGILDLKTILSHAQKSGLEHFIVERDLVSDPDVSLKKSFEYLHTLNLDS